MLNRYLLDEWMTATQCRLRDLGTGNVNPEGGVWGGTPRGASTAVELSLEPPFVSRSLQFGLSLLLFKEFPKSFGTYGQTLSQETDL